MKLYGVYHANGGFFGKLSYAAGKIRGSHNCALCDVTHGLVFEKSSFKNCTKDIPLSLNLVHLHEQPNALQSFTKGKTPCIVLHKEEQYHLVLDKKALINCHGDVVQFQKHLLAALEEHL